jgi:ATP-dependent DNA ligase
MPFDLLELDGRDLRREPLETRKATLASLLRGRSPGVRLNEHLKHQAARSSSVTPEDGPRRDRVEAAWVAVS